MLHNIITAFISPKGGGEEEINKRSKTCSLALTYNSVVLPAWTMFPAVTGYSVIEPDCFLRQTSKGHRVSQSGKGTRSSGSSDNIITRRQ